MTTQPEALRLADMIEACGAPGSYPAADELRRLHESNQELLSVLKVVLSESYDGPLHDDFRSQARAAINKALPLAGLSGG
jgi:hypothetical protein